MDQGIESFATGLSNSINSYLGASIKSNQEVQQHQQESDIDQNKQQALELYKQHLAGKVDADTASKINPQAAGIVSNFNQANGRMPSIDEFNSLLTNSDSAIATKEETRQDKLEKQYNDKLTQVRGDTSLMRTEHQRDSAGMAYDTINKAESENRPLTELEQTDLIGQLWQARTGKAPTDNDMKMLNDRTAKRGFNHVITYITGNPSLVGSSTPETLANLKQFVTTTGQKADQQWLAYMGPRMVPPTGLSSDRVAHVSQTHRGISFEDQQKVSNKTYVNQGPTLEDKKAALRTKLGL